jgi:hypothetical protein
MPSLDQRPHSQRETPVPTAGKRRIVEVAVVPFRTDYENAACAQGRRMRHLAMRYQLVSGPRNRDPRSRWRVVAGVSPKTAA